ncbi:MAG: beta-1,3-glucanase family protein [Deltaproteobacteria bacterium]|nr:beta-1,3-glucanase family protein [Deltaproteobacteria bacterium]
MRRINFWLTLAILGGLVLAAPALATTTIKQTIINNSGYPDNQVYLVFYGKLNSEIGTPAVGTFHRLDWPTGNFPAMSASDNTTDFSTHVPVPDPTTYANYSTTLDKLARDPISGNRFFNLPTVTDATAGFFSGRLYISFLNPVYLHVTDGKTISQPTYSPTAQDVNTVLKTVYDFFEPALDTDLQVWADTTNVDAVGMPLLYELRNGTTRIGGPKGLAMPLLTVRGAFSRDPVLKSLVTPTMIIAPGHGIENSVFSATYLDNYINYCWGYWDGSTPAKTLSFYYDQNTDHSLINWSGSVSSDKLTLTGTVNSATETHVINHPPTKDVFLCNGTLGAGTPPSPEPAGWTGRDKDLKNNVGSALNRTVMHLAPYPNGQTQFPWQAYLAGYNNNVFYGQNGLTAAQFATNVYAKLLHQLCYDKVNIYGFAYDDNCNISTTINGYADNLILTICDCTGLPTPYRDLLLLD